MKHLFFYKRLVEKGIDPETKLPLTIVVQDCLNVNKIVRGFWKSEKIFSVMLDDGHEQSEDRQRPVYKNGKAVGTETKRERDWFYSQIELDEEDGERLAQLYGDRKYYTDSGIATDSFTTTLRTSTP